MKLLSITSDFPVDKILFELGTLLACNEIVILKAAPGAGKTTRVPLFLLNEAWLSGKKILMLEPRRLAARNAALHMAHYSETPLGEVIGYRVRHEVQCQKNARVEVITEGILSKMFLTDPGLEDVACIIFDEFHERNLASDIGLGMAIECRRYFREDLRLLVMSATLELSPLETLMPESKILVCEGRQFPVEIEYESGPEDKPDLDQVVQVIKRSINSSEGNMLVFLPGVSEIKKVQEKLNSLTIEVMPLFGQLSFVEQQLVTRPSEGRRIILATDIAESSLTLPDIRVVIDAGFSRTPLYDPHTQLVRLVTRRCSLDSAEQRAGRAGRTAPGKAVRLWSLPRHRMLKPSREPEILQCDLERTVLELCAWGSDGSNFPWVSRPSEGLWNVSFQNLMFSKDIENNHLTERGRELLSYPMTPRLARILWTGKELKAETLAILIVTWWQSKFSQQAGEFDLEDRLKSFYQKLSGEAQQERKECDVLCQQMGVRWEKPDFSKLPLLLLKGRPDRLAKKRSQDHRRYILSTGTGVELPEEARALAGEMWLLCPICRSGQSEPKIQVALAMPESLLLQESLAFREEIEVLSFDVQKGAVLCEGLTKIFGLEWQRVTKPLPEQNKVTPILLKAIESMGRHGLPWEETGAWLQKYQIFQKMEDSSPLLSEEILMEKLEEWLAPQLVFHRKLSDIKSNEVLRGVQSLIDWSVLQKCDRWFPKYLEVPSGSKIELQYTDEKPILAVRIQEIFGWKNTPLLAEGRVPVTLHLLSPAYRPVQVTADLNSFWSAGYFEVRKELKRRYPKHSWPEDPLQASAISGPVRKPK